MTTLVFLSHSTKDRTTAETICGALERRGLKCWMSSRDIGPGENFQVTILRAIRRASVMVFVFSGNSNNSDEVKKEIAIASQNKLIVIPVRIEDVVPEEAFQYELATRQWIDMFDNWEQSIDRLVSQINSIANLPFAGGDSAEPSPPTQPSKVVEIPSRQLGVKPAPPPIRSTSSIGRYAAVAAVVIALAAGGAWWWKNQTPSPDEVAWGTAAKTDTVPAYQVYLLNEPQGTHVAQANTRIDALKTAQKSEADNIAWNAAAKNDTVAGYQLYTRIQPQGSHVADATARIAALMDAADEAGWTAATKVDTLAAYQFYIRNAPQGHHAADANARIAALNDAAGEAAWSTAAKSDTVAAYQFYLRSEPQGSHVAEANTRIAALSAANASATRDKGDYTQAIRQANSNGYRRFLSAHADSAFAVEIRRRLATCHTVSKANNVAENRPIQADGTGTGPDQNQACGNAQQDGIAQLRSQCPGVVAAVQVQNRQYHEDAAAQLIGNLFTLGGNRVIPHAGTCNVYVAASCSMSQSQSVEEERCE